MMYCGKCEWAARRWLINKGRDGERQGQMITGGPAHPETPSKSSPLLNHICLRLNSNVETVWLQQDTKLRVESWPIHHWIRLVSHQEPAGNGLLRHPLEVKPRWYFISYQNTSATWWLKSSVDFMINCCICFCLHRRRRPLSTFHRRLFATFATRADEAFYVIMKVQMQIQTRDLSFGGQEAKAMRAGHGSSVCPQRPAFAMTPVPMKTDKVVRRVSVIRG